jgi:hypothetical protein
MESNLAFKISVKSLVNENPVTLSTLLLNAVIVELSKLTTLDKRVISVSETKDYPQPYQLYYLKKLFTESKLVTADKRRNFCIINQ